MAIFIIGTSMHIRHLTETLSSAEDREQVCIHQLTVQNETTHSQKSAVLHKERKAKGGAYAAVSLLQLHLTACKHFSQGTQGTHNATNACDDPCLKLVSTVSSFDSLLRLLAIGMVLAQAQHFLAKKGVAPEKTAARTVHTARITPPNMVVLTWNEFRTANKGKGWSREKFSFEYKLYKATRLIQAQAA
jgi:hypothetical protein